MTLDSLLAAEAPRRLANLRDAGAASTLLRPGVLYRSDAPLSTDEDPPLRPWPPR